MNVPWTSLECPSFEPPVLVVGVGNECRGDDAAGRLIAEHTVAWDLPAVRCLSVNQHVPELAVEIADGRTLVVVDADLETPPGSFRAFRLHDSIGVQGSHHFPPGEPLQLAGLLGGRPQAAWLVGISSFHFDWAISPSANCEGAIRIALDWLRDRLPSSAHSIAEPADSAGSGLRSCDG